MIEKERKFKVENLLTENKDAGFSKTEKEDSDIPSIFPNAIILAELPGDNDEKKLTSAKLICIKDNKRRNKTIKRFTVSPPFSLFQ